MSALGLADYGSSDEEDDAVIAPSPVPKTNEGQVKQVVNQDKGKEPVHDIRPDPLPQPQQLPEDKALIGPALGPAPGPAAIPGDMIPEEAANQDGQPPASPYTANRLLLRNLTMPPVANFEIPPSPPGSPPPVTTAKFAHFLELKKKGVHFNERLNQSSALRNPGLLTKLMDFAGIGQEDQYASALPEAVAIPTKFPEWAYADKLVREHERIARKREDERAKMQREAVEFVPAKRLDVDSRPASGAPGAGRSGEGAGGRGGRPDVKRSRFDEKDRTETKRSRFDEKDGRSNRQNYRDRRGGRRSRSPR